MSGGDTVRDRVRALALEVKDMTVGLAPHERSGTGPVDLTALDEFGVVHLVLYVEDEFDLAILERLGAADWTTSDDVADFLTRTFSAGELRSRAEPHLP